MKSKNFWRCRRCHSGKSFVLKALVFESVDETLEFASVNIHLKATEQYFHVVLFIMLYKVVLNFKSVDETPVCDHSIEAIEHYFHVVLFIMLYKVVLSFKSVDETLVCDHSNESY